MQSLPNISKPKQPNQYTNYSIDADGKGWISQREIVRKINVPQSTFNDYVRKNLGQLIVNENNQLNANTLVKAVSYYANKGNKTAIDFTIKLMLAGAEVYIRGMAGKAPLEQEQNKAIASLSTQIGQQQDELLKKDGKITEQQCELFEKQTQINQLYRNGIKNPRAHLIQQKHKQYLQWVELGFLTHDIITTTRHNYNITNLGKNHLQQIQSNQFELRPDESEIQFELVGAEYDM